MASDAWVLDGRQRPCWAAQRIRRAGISAGGIESRRGVARISGRKAARHLRRRVQRSGRKAALACSMRAGVAPGADTSTCRETAVEPIRLGVAYRAIRLTTDRWTGPVYSVSLKRRCASVV